MVAGVQVVVLGHWPVHTPPRCHITSVRARVLVCSMRAGMVHIPCTRLPARVRAGKPLDSYSRRAVL